MQGGGHCIPTPVIKVSHYQQQVAPQAIIVNSIVYTLYYRLKVLLEHILPIFVSLGLVLAQLWSVLTKEVGGLSSLLQQ